MASSIETTSTTTTLKNNGNTYMSVDTNDAVTFATGVISVSSLNGGQLAGFRNRIINGDMQIDQRYAGASNVVTGTSYQLDRFDASNGAGGTMTFVQSTLGNAKSFLWTATAAVTDLDDNGLFMSHKIEGQNVFDLNGKEITISFKVQTNWAGNLPIAVRNSNSSRSYVVDVAVVSGTNDVSVTLTLEAASVITNDTALGLRLFFGSNNEGTLRTGTTGSWIAGSYRVSTSSTQWASTEANYINITGVQLEEGSVATPFEHRSYGTELALCQRYYEIGGHANSQQFSGDVTNSNNYFATIYFNTTKRAAPTIANANANASSFGTGASTAGAQSLNSFRNHRTSTASAVGSFGDTWTATAEL